MSEGAVAAPRRGRPRSERSRLAILGATTELLLEHGLAGANMDAVAERAGVGKGTIYRWWPTKESLALEALYWSWADLEPAEPDTGSLRGDLVALLLPWVRKLRARPYARVIAALIAKARDDPAFAAQYQAQFLEPRRELGRAAFARARARGELGAAVDVELALDLLYGPLYHRLLHGHAPLSDSFVDAVVDAAISGMSR